MCNVSNRSFSYFILQTFEVGSSHHQGISQTRIPSVVLPISSTCDDFTKKSRHGEFTVTSYGFSTVHKYQCSYPFFVFGMAASFAKQIVAIPAGVWASALATVPILLWANDSLFSLYRVSGSSMEPSLRHGDIVVVRKSDGIWQKQTRKEEDPMLTFQRRHQIDLEKIHCHSNGVSWLLHKPPTPIVDDIVVYKDPTEYPWKYSIKRVIGLGQQVVMIPSNRYKPTSSFQIDTVTPETFSSMRVASPCVPSLSLWVEGDNFTNSKDSSTSHGPVTKKLLVGVAEFRIWPPTRVGRIGPSTDRRQEPKPYSYWPQV